MPIFVVFDKYAKHRDPASDIPHVLLQLGTNPGHWIMTIPYMRYHDSALYALYPSPSCLIPALHKSVGP